MRGCDYGLRLGGLGWCKAVKVVGLLITIVVTLIIIAVTVVIVVTLATICTIADIGFPPMTLFSPLYAAFSAAGAS